ncbi:PTS transporter subunit EIIB [Spiroplasma sabaudiense]|uniref:PTS transporter subunit EIIB n=1 Tax=Spiroplasma sabaudiense TaxID=216944 RepID=UPI00046CFAC8|nr:PTS glucose/sucrose transporter subunit IIB [Spiroplasma sabaudiense]
MPKIYIKYDDPKKIHDQLNELLNEKSSSKKTASKADQIDGYDISLLRNILDGLGGDENIALLDNCATRLRVTVKDSSLVNEALLKTTKALGVKVAGTGVQVIYGPYISSLKPAIEKLWVNHN